MSSGNETIVFPPGVTTPAELFYAYTFHFYPSVLPGALVCATFAVFTVVLLGLTLKFGGRYMYFLVASALLETIGYGMRVMIAQAVPAKPSLTSYMIFALFTLLPPIFMALVNYYVVGKLIEASGKTVRLLGRELHHNHVARVFLGGDILTLWIQGGGSGLLIIQNTTFNTLGLAVVLFGLVLQLFFFVAFVWIIRRVAVDAEYWTPMAARLPKLKQIYLGLNLTIGFLFVRNVYRIVEFALSSQPSINQPMELVFFLFESTAILSALFCYSVFHFGHLFNYKEADVQASADQAVHLDQFDTV